MVHALRHTYATRLAEDGADATEIQALLGHESLNTSRGYIEDRQPDPAGGPGQPDLPGPRRARRHWDAARPTADGKRHSPTGSLMPESSTTNYGGGVESREPVTLDLDAAEAEINQRWFVWTAAGLTVHPVTWTDHNDAGAAPRVGRSEVTSLGSVGLQVSRPDAHVNIVVQRDGWAEMAVLRPGADTVVRATAQLESIAAFAALVDRAVELITWSGVAKDRECQHSERAGQWVAGYDGEGWSTGS